MVLYVCMEGFQIETNSKHPVFCLVWAAQCNLHPWQPRMLLVTLKKGTKPAKKDEKEKPSKEANKEKDPKDSKEKPTKAPKKTKK